MTPGEIRDLWGRHASPIYGRLWQSGFPYPITQVPAAGIDLLVLTSAEAQPDPRSLSMMRQNFPRLNGVLCPLDDTEDVSKLASITERAQTAADKVVAHLRRGHTVLVTCSVGRNRSGLVSALALRRLLDISGRDAAQMVRAARNPDLPPGEGALTNTAFSHYLQGLS